MKKLIIALVVLAALFVVVDRVTVGAAEQVVGRRAQLTADLETQPDVTVRGFPFLTQAVGGVYRQVDLSLDSMQRSDVRLKNIDVHLHDVHAPLEQMLRREGSVTVRAESATATATVPYAVLADRMPSGLHARAKDGRLQLTGSVTVLGRDLNAKSLGKLSVQDGKLTFHPDKIDVEGLAVTDQLAGRFNFAVDVGELPFGLRISGAKVTKGGVRLRAAGKNLLLTGSDVTTK